MKNGRKIGLAMLLTLMASTFPVQADLWKCEGANGIPLITDTKPSSTKGCKLYSKTPPLATMAAPKSRQASAAATPSPQNFPKVNGDLQRGRDQTRRQILDKELAEEQNQLEKARAVLAEQPANGDERQRKPLQDRVAEHQRNIEALRLEMSKLR